MVRKWLLRAHQTKLTCLHRPKPKVVDIEGLVYWPERGIGIRFLHLLLEGATRLSKSIADIILIGIVIACVNDFALVAVNQKVGELGHSGLRKLCLRNYTRQ